MRNTYTDVAPQATSTIPIVFCTHGDPIAAGDVASLARPGGNMTSISSQSTEISVKALELLTKAVPGRLRVAVLGIRHDCQIARL